MKAASVVASVIVVMVGAFLIAHIAGAGRSSSPAEPRRPAPAGSAPAAPSTVRSALVTNLDRAQQIIDDTSSTGRALASAGRFEQLATRVLDGETAPVRRVTLTRLGKAAAASMRANLEAAAALSGLATPHQGLPPWKIVQPPAANTLRGYFRAAQSRFGVPWEDLAAIEFIETNFGRVRGSSPAGAQGPMQFMPATWASYGSGRIDNQRDAVLSAARYLVVNGAPGDMADALYHYNNSRDYIHAVQDYARRMHADNRAYYGYYYWQVVYPHVGGAVILPAGYPKARPVPFR